MNPLENKPQANPSIMEHISKEANAASSKDYFSEMARIIDNPNVSPEQAKGALTGLIDEHVVAETQKMLRSEQATTDKIVAQAGKLGKARYEDGLAAMRSKFADPEEAVNNAEEVQRQLKRTVNSDRFNLHLTLARNESERKTDNMSQVERTAYGTAFLATPTYAEGVYQSLAEVFPEAAEWTDRFTMGQSLDFAAKKIVDAESPEEAERLTRAVISSMRKNLGVLFDNEFSFQSALNDLESRVTSLRETGETSEFWSTVDDVFGMLEYVGVGQSIRGGVKSGIKKVADYALDAWNIELIGGTPASVLATTKKGAVKLANASTDELLEMGTTPVEVTGNLMLPNIGKTVDNGLPMVFEELAVPASVEPILREARETAAKNTFGKRLHNTDMEFDRATNTMSYNMRLGTKDGKTFKTEAKAKRMADEVGGEVEQAADGSYVVSIKGTDYFNDELTQPLYQDDVIRKDTWWNKLGGKATQFSKRLVDSSTVALTRTVKMQQAIRKDMKPYDDLSTGEQIAVSLLLKKGDETHHAYTRAELAADNFSPKQIEAYFAVRQAVKKTLALKNHSVRTRMKAEGWRSYKGGNNDYILRQLDEKPTGDVFDIESGKLVRGGDDAEFDFYAIKGDGVKTRWARLPKYTQTKDLPYNILGDTTGYIPRFYNSPWFVRKRFPNGQTKAVHTARSDGEGEDIIAKLKEEDPEGDYFTVRSDQVAQDARSFDELEELDAQGMLYTNKRRDDPLTGIDGTTSGMADPRRAINAVPNIGGKSVGVGQWTNQMIAMWKKGFPDLEFNMLQPPTRASKVTEEEYKKARQLWDFINMVNGTHPSQLGVFSQAIRNDIGDFLASSGNGYIAGIRNWFAREAYGTTTHAVTLGKSMAFGAYLSLNPIRQALMQATMIPTYFAVDGGARYAVSGKFFKDFAILAQHKMGNGKKAAKHLDSDNSDTAAMLKAWDASGLDELSSEHAFVVGSIADSAVPSIGSAAGRAIGKAANKFKEYGFDIGVRADKRAAFLMSWNRFKAQNGRVAKSQKDIDEVTAFAERLSLNQNRSDELFTSHGVLGVFTQFLSHQFKMANRIMLREHGMPKSEAARMALMSLSTYGVAGFGLYEAFDRGLQEAGVDMNNVPQDLRNIIRDGLLGWAVDRTIWAATGDDVDLDTSKMSPTNVTIAVDAIGFGYNAMKGLFRGDLSNLTEFKFDLANAPALGITGSVLETMKFATRLGGTTSDMVSAPEVAMQSIHKAMTTFPLYNQAFRGYLGMQLEASVDSRGNPVLEASKGELIAYMLTGLKTNRETDLQTSREKFYGEYSGMSGSDEKGMVQRAAKEYAREVLLPMMVDVSGNRRTVAEMFELMDTNNALMHFALSPINKEAFHRTVLTELNKSGIMKNEDYTNKLWEHINSFNAVPNGNLEQAIRLAPIDQETKDAMLLELKNMGEYNG